MTAAARSDTLMVVDTGDGVFTATLGKIAVQAMFVQVATEAISSTSKTKVGSVVNVLNFGAMGDNETDDTGAIQAALNSGAQAVYIPEGTYLVRSALSITAPLRLCGEGKIQEATLLDATIIVSADDVQVEGLTFEGGETLANWEAGDDTHRQALKSFVSFVKVTDCSVSGIRTSGKRGSVQFSDCFRCSVVGLQQTGIFGEITNEVSDANFHTSVCIAGGGQHSVSDIRVSGGGSAVLIGSDSSENLISKVFGYNLHDNAIYNSSGDKSVFSECFAQSIKGTGIKARGAHHSVVNNVVEAALTGVSLTGNGDMPDAFGVNGSGSVVSRNMIRDCSGAGILVGLQDNYLMRDIVIAENTVSGHTGDNGNAPIIVTVKQGAKVSNNVVDGCVATYAIVVAGKENDPAMCCVIDSNTISNAKGEGIRSLYLEHSSISGNKFNAVTSNAIEARFCNHCYCTDNIVKGTSNIRFNSAYSCRDNFIADNEVQSNGRIRADASINTIRLK